MAIDKRLACAFLILQSAVAYGQTTAGASAAIVVPVIAQTSSFTSEVTAFNPNANAISIDIAFYDANNTAFPGPKPCLPLLLQSGQSTQFSLAGQCTLPTGSNFGLLVLSERSGAQGFYGFSRTETPSGVGFSTEGFPIENFNDQTQHVTGLKRVAANAGQSGFQTNCFVATLDGPVDYQLRLFNGSTGVQIGGTLSGSLGAFQQFRYLDVFGASVVPSGDYTNVRATFTNLTGARNKLIGFCTVQDNKTLSADFRIAKSFGGSPQNAFVQGGNAFGTMALLGTVDNQGFTVLVNNEPALRLDPATNATDTNTINVTNGSPLNTIDPGAVGATIGGGGGSYAGGSPNRATESYATIAGGVRNVAGAFATVAGGWANRSGEYAAVGGGVGNSADGFAAAVSGGNNNRALGTFATVSGGAQNEALGNSAVVVGGQQNSASGFNSFAAGAAAQADQSQCAVFALWSTGFPIPMNCLGVGNIFRVGADHGFSVDYASQRFDGSGSRWVAIGDTYVGQTIATWTGAFLSDGGAWINASDRDQKQHLTEVDRQDVLAKVIALPIARWNYKTEPDQWHIGPVAQDFYAAFRLGRDDKHIATIDQEGVALAAIQGLYQLIADKDTTIATQQSAITALTGRVAELESLFGDMDALRAAVAEFRLRSAPRQW